MPVRRESLGPDAGKSGGARVIYFYAVSPDYLFLLTCYAKSRQSDLSVNQKKLLAATVREIKDSMKELMTTKQDTQFGHDLIASMKEALAHVRGEIDLPTCEVAPKDVDVAGLRKRMEMTQAGFSRLFGFSPRALQDWEQGRRQPERSARVLLTVIEHNPEAVIEALQAAMVMTRKPARKLAAKPRNAKRKPVTRAKSDPKSGRKAGNPQRAA